MNNLYRFKARIYPDIPEFYDEDELDKFGRATESGIIAGETIGDAIDNLADFYGGEEFISKLSIEPCDVVLLDDDLRDMVGE